MKKYFFLLGLLFINYTFSQSVKLSVYSEVSIVTVGPGGDLYSAFGHTAIRIKDPVLRMDTAYNYGMFDSYESNFYVKFAYGKLLYKLGAYPFGRFVKQNQYEKRWLKEQILNISQSERQKIFEYLTENLQPQNASYLYDPFYDNCATKPMEILLELLPNIRLDESYVSNEETIRSLMNEELNQNTWSSVGINIALGSKIDNEMVVKDYWYLPDFVFKALKKGSIEKDGKKISLVKKENQILDFGEKRIKSSLSPLIVFSSLFIVSLILMIRSSQFSRFIFWFDTIFFMLIGLIGLGIVFLWFFTDHTTTPSNFNILWCFPLSVFFPFILKRRKIIFIYLRSILLLLAVTIIVWISAIQTFNIYLIPLLFAIAIRTIANMKLLAFKE